MRVVEAMGAGAQELEDVSFTSRLAEVLEHLAGLRYVEQVLSSQPKITAELAALFAVQFDPDRYPDAPLDRIAEADRLAARRSGQVRVSGQ